MLEIVLDKSYLDRRASVSVVRLCDRYTVLMPQELFFEMMTTSAESQRRCFSKLPDRNNPVALIPPAGFLFRVELQHQRGCAPLSQHRVDAYPYAFNQRLRDGTFVPQAEDWERLTEWRNKVKADTQRFVNRCLVVHHFFSELNGINQKDFRAAVSAARQKIARDAHFVRQIYASFLNEHAPPGAPSPDLLDPGWAFFRWVQCQMLSALRIFARYRGALPREAGPEFWTRVEHSMLDVYYVILGSLAGGLATFDNEIKEDFLLLCPDSVTLAPGVFVRGQG